MDTDRADIPEALSSSSSAVAQVMTINENTVQGHGFSDWASKNPQRFLRRRKVGFWSEMGFIFNRMISVMFLELFLKHTTTLLAVLPMCQSIYEQNISFLSLMYNPKSKKGWDVGQIVNKNRRQ